MVRVVAHWKDVRVLSLSLAIVTVLAAVWASRPVYTGEHLALINPRTHGLVHGSVNIGMSQ